MQHALAFHISSKWSFTEIHRDFLDTQIIFTVVEL
jgi:hypothetical protein